MKRKIKENIHLILTAIVTIIILIISMTISRNVVFSNEIQDMGFYYFTLISYSILVFVATYFIIRFIKNIVKKDEFSIKMLKHFAIYFGILLIFLILIWPGYWVWDEIWIIDSTTNGVMYTWQSVITQLFYAYAMLLIPSPVGITIIQAIIISLCIAFLHTKIEKRFNKKCYNIIIYILMLTPAIIINDLYALRLQLYAYVMLVLFTNLIFDYWDKKKINLPKAIFLYFLSALIILWRSEGIIFLIIIPVLMAIAYKSLRKISIVVLMIVINAVTYLGYSKIIPSDSRYQTIIFMNPLSIMLQEDLKGDNIQEDLEKIDKVMDVELIKENPSYIETPAYWNYQNTIFRDDYEEHMTEFYMAYIDIVINNPMEFLEARVKTFLASSGMDDSTAKVGAFTEYFINETDKSEAITEFLDKYKIMNPINANLKVSIETSLVGVGNAKETIMRPIFWNVVPILLLMFIVMIERLIHKDFIVCMIILSLFAKTVVVFLTAPASYFMYYLPEYVCGMVIIVLSIYKRIEEKKILKLESNYKT